MEFITITGTSCIFSLVVVIKMCIIQLYQRLHETRYDWRMISDIQDVTVTAVHFQVLQWCLPV